MKLFDSLWTFFTSVKLAIFTLCALSVTSIVGTIIPQGKPYSFYVSNYGAKTAQFFHILDIPEMYSSWWFLGLLGLLSINLIICSLDRFPKVLRLINADNLAISPEKMGKMPFFRKWRLPGNHPGPEGLSGLLDRAGWKNMSRTTDRGELYFSQRYKWSRTGVYIVHLSILIIFIGAIIGTLLGFKGSVMLPEQGSTKMVYAAKDSSTIPLGFEIRCESFTIDFYDNGMPKDYTSRLTILEQDQVILQKDIEVNSPLTYRGVTFYQASYEAYRDFILKVTSTATDQSRVFVIPFQQQVSWDDQGLQFGIINAEAMGQRVVRLKVWFKSGENPASVFWLDDNATSQVSIGGKDFSVSAKQMYATGLQVAKDPGVWVVYAGCGLMMIGLFMAFFLSHKKIWLYKQADDHGITIYLSGSTHKNKPAFAGVFARIEALVDRAITAGTTGENTNSH